SSARAGAAETNTATPSNSHRAIMTPPIGWARTLHTLQPRALRPAGRPSPPARRRGRPRTPKTLPAAGAWGSAWPGVATRPRHELVPTAPAEHGQLPDCEALPLRLPGDVDAEGEEEELVVGADGVGVERQQGQDGVGDRARPQQHQVAEPDEGPALPRV